MKISQRCEKYVRKSSQNNFYNKCYKSCSFLYLVCSPAYQEYKGRRWRVKESILLQDPFGIAIDFKLKHTLVYF